MTPQAFSYGTLGSNNKIYIPPYGLKESLNYMLKLDPVTFCVDKIFLDVNDSTEKWQNGIAYKNFIYFLPYNESKVLIINTDNDVVSYIPLENVGRGMYIQPHLHNEEIIALPYGEYDLFDYALHIDTRTHTATQIKINLPINDEKKWHTCQIIDDIIYGLPRGENWIQSLGYFPYGIEYNCKLKNYKLNDMSIFWKDYDQESYTNKKYTTLAKLDNKLYAPPYSQNPNFDVMLKFIDNKWIAERTGQKQTSRKYYSHTVTKNNKIYFPPAGHDEDWDELLIIDSDTDQWYTKELGIGKESKKYFAGSENSQGKIYYIPRGGCVCEPEHTWKSQGDLAEILVIDTKDDSCYTIDVSEYFIDNTTIEKYNNCIITNDIIFAFPYGESNSFQTILVFDTINEKVIRTIDLNDI